MFAVRLHFFFASPPASAAEDEENPTNDTTSERPRALVIPQQPYSLRQPGARASSQSCSLTHFHIPPEVAATTATTTLCSQTVKVGVFSSGARVVNSRSLNSTARGPSPHPRLSASPVAHQCGCGPSLCWPRPQSSPARLLLAQTLSSPSAASSRSVPRASRSRASPTQPPPWRSCSPAAPPHIPSPPPAASATAHSSCTPPS